MYVEGSRSRFLMGFRVSPRIQTQIRCWSRLDVPRRPASMLDSSQRLFERQDLGCLMTTLPRPRGRRQLNFFFASTLHQLPSINRMSSASMPDLPAEIWIAILREATLIPGFLALDILEVEFSGPPPMYLTSRSQPEHIKTRAAIVLVCKQWRLWTAPFLYEYVVIRSGRSLCSLLEALRRSPRAFNLDDIAFSSSQQDLSFHRPFGNLVKRLDLALYEYSRNGAQTTRGSHEDWEVITQIVGYLPNLRSLNFYPDTQNNLIVDMPTSLAQILAQTCGDSLQILNTFNDIYRFQLPDLYGLLLHTPNLRVLRCRAHDLLTYLGFPPPSCRPTWITKVPIPDPLTKIVLPHLVSIYVRSRVEFTGRISSLPVLSTPHIRHAVIHSSGPAPGFPDPFLLTGVFSLTYIQFHQNHLPFNYHILMDQLQEDCPNLRGLDLHVVCWNALTVGIDFPHSIEELGLASQPDYADEDEPCSTLLSTLRSIRFNNVKVVKILRQADEDDLRRSPDQVYHGIFKLLEGQGVRLE
ncbi:hypothetical protein BDN72DRAFT_68014 [Pluteus cervinus]|uniref:Uncharacterized protein n=1 Tax=Pluteus cervinus TaxID=181527 RepID=A0ACD2ZYP0_9AGAR|nr:hypothetical protein BDN72DRAFT_68014 [Pluteus cervinus]